MLNNDIMHPINIGWLLYDMLDVAVRSFIPETLLRKRPKRSSRKGRGGGEETEDERDEQRSRRHSHRSSSHTRHLSSANTSLNASAFASGELPPQVPQRSRSHSGNRHTRRERPATTSRWSDWRRIDVTKQAYVLSHILQATPVALLHFLCQFKTDVATLPLLGFSDLGRSARSLLWFDEDAVFASSMVVAFTITRVLLRLGQQYVMERLLFETNIVVRRLRSRRVWQNALGWALTIGGHTLTDPIAFSTVACMLLVRNENVHQLRGVKYTPAGVLAAVAVGCAGVVLEIMLTPVAAQLCQCGVVRVFDAAEYLLLRRYASEAMEDDNEDEGDDDDDGGGSTVNNDVVVVASVGNDSDNADARAHKRSNSDKSRNNHNSSSSVMGEEQRKERRERRREREHSRSSSHNTSREERGASNANSEDEHDATERSQPLRRRRPTPSSLSKRESLNSSRSHPLTDDSDNERAAQKVSKKGNDDANHSRSRIREKRKSERKKERKDERDGKARRAEEKAILRAIIYRVVASLTAQCVVQHPLTVLAHMLYNRAVLHGVGLLTAYDTLPNEPLTWQACLQFLRKSGRNYNSSSEQSSGVLIVEVLRSIGYFIGHEVSMVGGSIRSCSSQDASIRALVEMAEKTRRQGDNGANTDLRNRGLAMESAELMARSIASLSPLFTAVQFTAIDKLLGFYMAVWVRLIYG